jgi:hypothetical protein
VAYYGYRNYTQETERARTSARKEAEREELADRAVKEAAEAAARSAEEQARDAAQKRDPAGPEDLVIGFESRIADRLIDGVWQDGRLRIDEMPPPPAGVGQEDARSALMRWRGRVTSHPALTMRYSWMGPQRDGIFVRSTGTLTLFPASGSIQTVDRFQVLGRSYPRKGALFEG